jgi:hypothetical protein
MVHHRSSRRKAAGRTRASPFAISASISRCCSAARWRRAGKQASACRELPAVRSVRLRLRVRRSALRPHLSELNSSGDAPAADRRIVRTARFRSLCPDHALMRACIE